MSFLDTLKQDALAVLHTTANALHAQFAHTLAQAGHTVTESDHVDTLVATAVAAATGAAGATSASSTAPNYADFALATFQQSMTAALIQFAQHHLPAKFQGVAADAAQTVSDATTPGISPATIANDVLDVATLAAGVVVPGAAPIAGLVTPMIEAVVDKVLDAPKPQTAMNTQGV